MRVAVTIEISNQLSEVLSVIERHLESTLLAVHLYGSAVDGGLKPYSDIDLLVTVAVKLDETTRRALLNDLMGHCCKVSDEAAFCLIQRPYISKTLLT
ncbi:nucleotidyltransferase domain-containing protein, partial [Salmonella sp. NW290]|uniref:nucleotidyltransferase domain-containing protein n=1 Tax=Salmonella sp. NW290 TaxID=2947872 RepID=UPI003F42842A